MANFDAVNIGFFGGRFDPVHFGHLGAAQEAFVRHKLDRLIFVPTAQVPHQSQNILASAADRIAMLRLATASHPQFEISEHELGLRGASYTIDSVRHFRGLYPRDRLFWIIGGDQLGRLHDWKGVRELALLAEFIVLMRPGHAKHLDADIPGLRLHGCDTRMIGISATELRKRVKDGLSLDNLVPDAVAGYIARNGLYRA